MEIFLATLLISPALSGDRFDVERPRLAQGLEAPATALFDKPKAANDKLRGVIVFVDPLRGELMIQADDVVHLLPVAADATIMRGEKAIRLETIRSGERVMVVIREDEDQSPTVQFIEVEPEQ